MADLNQVVDLGAPTDASVPQRSAIHRRVGTDLHIIAHRDATQVVDLLESSLLGPHVPEARATEHGTRSHDDPITENTAGSQHAARVKDAIRSHLDPVIEHRPGVDHAAGSHPNSLAQRAVRAHVGTLVNACPRVHHGTRVHTGLRLRERKDAPGSPKEVATRIPRAQHRSVVEFDVRRGHEGPCPGTRGPSRVDVRTHEAQIPRPRVLQGSDTLDTEIGIALHHESEFVGQRSEARRALRHSACEQHRDG